jgi:hypothetical protein
MAFGDSVKVDEFPKKRQLPKPSLLEMPGNPKIDRDLSTICLKCLEKDPQRRHSSALVLGEDLEHWLKHEPIRARRIGIAIRGRKWVPTQPNQGGADSLVDRAVGGDWNAGVESGAGTCICGHRSAAI